MSKARDLANAGTALTTVSATELGYLDGVTSAVQTQVDAKIAKTLTTTTGDIIYASSANTPARLGVGSTGNVLTVSGGVPAWAAPAGGGKVLQVVNATQSTAASTASASFSDTGLSATITPTSATSKILVLVDQSGCKKGNSDTDMTLKLVRGATDILTIVNQAGGTDGGSTINYGSVSACYLDAPATTSATTYKTTFNSRQASSFTQVQTASSNSTITLLEIGA